jgi:hypothetical protein
MALVTIVAAAVLIHVERTGRRRQASISLEAALYDSEQPFAPAVVRLTKTTVHATTEPRVALRKAIAAMGRPFMRDGFGVHI